MSSKYLIKAHGGTRWLIDSVRNESVRFSLNSNSRNFLSLAPVKCLSDAESRALFA